MTVSEILPGHLWQSGSLTDDSWQALGIDAVVSLVEGDDPVPKGADCGFLYVRWPIEDGPMPDPEVVRALARLVVDLLEADRKVLVHCGAGINRSSLVTAAALVVLGTPPDGALAALRAQRDPLCLCNPHFEAWVRAGC